MIKVVIFDLDGLLVDSQPLQYKAYNRVFSRAGYPLTIDDWHEWIHNSYSPKIWIKKHNLPLDPATVREEKKIIYDRLVREEMQLKPGVLDLINALYGKFRLCVASSSRIESVKLVVEKFGLESKFEKLVSDTEMARGKPHPDVFLKTAEMMGAKPGECVVIEDSLAGLRAAKAAKMACIVCPDLFGGFKPEGFDGADKIVKSLGGVTVEMIARLGD